MRRTHPLQSWAWYRGLMVCYGIVEAHHPDRVLRQFGRTQIIPLDPLFGGNPHKSGKWMPTYKVNEGYWVDFANNIKLHVLPKELRGNVAVTHGDYEDDWLRYYMRISHPRVHNPDAGIAEWVRVIFFKQIYLHFTYTSVGLIFIYICVCF